MYYTNCFLPKMPNRIHSQMQYINSIFSSLIFFQTATSSTSVEDKIRPTTMQTVSSVEIPKLESRRLGTSKSGRLVYYPKPIPPPEVLPLTRTVSNTKSLLSYLGIYIYIPNAWIVANIICVFDLSISQSVVLWTEIHKTL